jgi:hypothetical protein
MGTLPVAAIAMTATRQSMPVQQRFAGMVLMKTVTATSMEVTLTAM